MRICLALLLGSFALLGCSAPEAKEPLKDILKEVFKKPSTEPLKAHLTVQNQQTGGRSIPAGLFGTNLQWEHEGDGLLRGQKDGKIPAILQRDIGVLAPTSIRFPGGALANSYRWKSGIGVREKRAKGKSFGGQLVASTFGTDEFIGLLNATAAAPLITVNLSAGAEEAAEWVEYLNGSSDSRWGKERQKNVGAAPPRAMYWEIGNELYAPNEPGHLTAQTYAAKLKEFASAMKKRDPKIKIGAIMEASFQEAAWMANVMPHLLAWNEQVLKAIGPEVDFLSLHFYTPFDTLGREADLNRLVWAGPVAFERTLARIREQARKHGKPNLEIAVTEYGTYFGEKVTLNPRIGGTENALFNTLLMMSFMRQPDVTVANHWSLINNSMFGMLTWEGGKLNRRPWRDAYTRLREFVGAELVPVNVESDGFAVPAKGNVPDIPKLSAIDAVAVRESDRWRMALVNRSPDRDADVVLDAKVGEVPAQVKMTTLVPERGGRTWATTAPAKLVREQGKQEYRFKLPAQSIVFLE